MATTNPNDSYALNDPDEVKRRLELLLQDHIAPLNEFRNLLRDTMGPDYDSPDFDPCDGGVHAESLFLLEAPGAKAVGSGFISRNNPDPTARNMNELLTEAGIPRARSLLWNVVPWYVGTETKIRPVSVSDLGTALPWTERLIDLLPQLKVIVLMGKKAQRVSTSLAKVTDLQVLAAFHPSNLSLNRYPERRAEVLSVLQEAARILGV